jgi:hypothetical protein
MIFRGEGKGNYELQITKDRPGGAVAEFTSPRFDRDGGINPPLLRKSPLPKGEGYDFSGRLHAARMNPYPFAKGGTSSPQGKRLCFF